MPQFSANLNFLFNEHPFMERFAAAAKAGFKNVEFMFPYDFDIAQVKEELEKNNLKLVLFNLPAGDWAGGDRGLAADPDRKAEFTASVGKAVEAAGILGTKKVNCLCGMVKGNYSREEVLTNIADNLAYAAREFQKAGLDLMVEPINHIDMPGFTINTTKHGMEVIELAKEPNIYLQYDIYHADKEEENHDEIIEKYLSKIGHVQVADNPGRNQPGTGSIKIKEIFETLAQKGYEGYIGMEYKPTGDTVDSLSWVGSYGYKL
ncbi:Hydroxypyruvate isomerase [Syntrophobotulus glycolicus DSM 8271]|uniref:Hydroxypyruvate isomerase n=1 Tax=Syntrophobotulus glycolicus (strain DSM 8271 / FlGlyR) TaxID=645991 RepID=F0T0Y8_SYNGF|nr:TIM barrel protein [Syntrophobotulus glycolicus]ADY57359.1 Hydroxypyruvate isomerase [Syntrophobotulus glycolicus DSM 8271]